MTKGMDRIKELEEKQSEALYDLIMREDSQWRKNWVSDGFMQQSGETGNAYKNTNQLMLFTSAVDNNFSDPRWLTFNQIVKKGFKLEKGSKGTPISFVTNTKKELIKDENNKPILDEKGEKQYEIVKLDYPVLKIYHVFNATNIKGIDPFVLDNLSGDNKAKMKEDKYQDLDRMIKNFCSKNDISIKEIASDKAFFSNGDENKTVLLPLKSQFANLDDYYAVAFHEVAHATKILGIRINQETDTPKGNVFGSKNYAKEELTAELTSMYLCKEFRLDGAYSSDSGNNSLAYLKGWLQNGQLEKSDLSVAMKEAQRASNVIYKEYLSLNIKEEQKIDVPLKQVSKKSETKGLSI